MPQRPVGVVLAVLLLAACGKKDESLAKKAGAKVGETLTDIAHGVDAGIDRGRAVPVVVTEGLAARGVGATVSKRDAATVSVYLTSREAMDLQIVVKALDRGESEIGRAKAVVTFEKDDAKYVSLEFPREMDVALVAKYVVDETR